MVIVVCTRGYGKYGRHDIYKGRGVFVHEQSSRNWLTSLLRSICSD